MNWICRYRISVWRMSRFKIESPIPQLAMN
jgi:hypothetical protein